jgi:L,D-peptidoglycan transpeptidase YkuD (ErfK/YbiS/YcfS/YnhG family)
MRRAGIQVVTVLALTASGLLLATAKASTSATPGRVATAKASAPATPGRIGTLRRATRAIVVVSRSWRTTRAVLRTYERARPGDRWRLVRGPMPARIGYNGFSANRREGDGTTPAGTFGFVYGFGSRPDPGMRGFAYRRLRPSSCWSGSRADYNRWVTRRCTRGESLWKNRRVAYRYAAVIDFNYRRPVYGKGSGIFLHQQTGGPTAGCVSLRPRDLVAVLRWLRPGTRIAMGPARYLDRL